MAAGLNRIYQMLFAAFGPQKWWPADSAFEVMVGAILTQNTSWHNVTKAIDNLKKHDMLDPHKLLKLPEKKLAAFIRPAGFYNLKAKRLRNFLKFFIERYSGDARKMSRPAAKTLRAELLSINGIGEETADSILLYALKKPVFVVDAYTRRIFARHGFIRDSASYEQIQNIFLARLPADEKKFNEYHALLVRLGKEFCLKNSPRCEKCPIK